jgi:transposase
MLAFAIETPIYLIAGATDMRKAFDGLSAIVSGQLEIDPSAGQLFVFCNARRNRLKILQFDPSGVWVAAKRLEKGTFRWPESHERTIELSYEELVMIVGGLDATHTRRRRWYGRG